MSNSINKHDAFISYSHQSDAQFASLLRSELSKFAKPWYKIRSLRIFLDKTSLAANPSLWPTIETALESSKYFLLIASPASAKSHWVEKELDWWLKHRSIDTIIILLTEGVIQWNQDNEDYDWSQTNALPQSLEKKFRNEPFFVDCREFKNIKQRSSHNKSFRNALLDIASPLFGVQKDNLDGADIRQQKINKRWAYSAGVSVFVTLIATVISLRFGWQKKIEIESRDLVLKSEQLRRYPEKLPFSVFLAAKAMTIFNSLEADQALYTGLKILGPTPDNAMTFTGMNHIVLSPSGSYIALIPYDGNMAVRNPENGKTIVNLLNPDANAIRQAAFSVDDQRVATMSSLGLSACVWRLPEGNIVFHTPANIHEITTIAINADGKILATGHIDGTIRIWDIDKNTLLKSLSLRDAPNHLLFSPDNQYLAGSSSQSLNYGPKSRKYVALWDIKSGKEIRILEHSSSIKDFVFSSDSQYLATSSIKIIDNTSADSGMIKIWKTQSGKNITEINQNSQVNTLCFSPNNKYLFTGNSNGEVSAWETNTGKKTLHLEHSSSIGLVTFIPIENLKYLLAIADSKGCIYIRDITENTNELIRLFEEKNVLDLKVNKNKKYIISLSHNLEDDINKKPEKYTRLLNKWSTNNLLSLLPMAHDNNVMELRCHEDNTAHELYLSTLTLTAPKIRMIQSDPKKPASMEFIDNGSGSLNTWNLETHQKIAYQVHPGAVMAIDCDDSGKHIVTGCNDGIVRIYDKEGANILKHYKSDGWIYYVAISPDRKYIAFCSGSSKMLENKAGMCKVLIWDWNQDKTLKEFSYSALILSMAFSRDGQYLAVGGSNKQIDLIDMHKLIIAKRFPIKHSVIAIKFSPNRNHLAAITNSAMDNEFEQLQHKKTGELKVLNINNGEHFSWNSENDRPIAMDVTKDGKLLASMTEKGSISVIDMQSHQKIKTLRHNAQMLDGSLCFTRDGQYLCSCLGDFASIWNINTGEEIARRQHDKGILYRAFFSTNDKYLVTISNDMTARTWLWKRLDMIHETKKRLTGIIPSKDISLLSK